MKIIFFGTPEIAVPSLKELISTPEVEILGVVTQKDKKSGRKNLLTPPPVKIVAEEAKIPIIQPDNKKELTKSLQQIAEKQKIDLFVVIAFGMILTDEILKIPKYGAINIHFSLLPKYRGASPIQEALLNGDNESGISVIKMDNQLDHGGLLLVKRVPINEKENSETLANKLATLSAELLPLIVEDIHQKNLTEIPQDHKKATYCHKITKEQGEINWDLSAEEIYNMVRAYTPWPSAYTTVKDKKLKIIEAEFDSQEKGLAKGEFAVKENILKIGTAKGGLIPTKVQLEGKKEMEVSAFLNGYRALFT